MHKSIDSFYNTHFFSIIMNHWWEKIFYYLRFRTPGIRSCINRIPSFSYISAADFFSLPISGDSLLHIQMMESKRYLFLCGRFWSVTIYGHSNNTIIFIHLLCVTEIRFPSFSLSFEFFLSTSSPASLSLTTDHFVKRAKLIKALVNEPPPQDCLRIPSDETWYSISDKGSSVSWELEVFKPIRNW